MSQRRRQLEPMALRQDQPGLKNNFKWDTFLITEEESQLESEPSSLKREEEEKLQRSEEDQTK